MQLSTVMRTYVRVSMSQCACVSIRTVIKATHGPRRRRLEAAQHGPEGGLITAHSQNSNLTQELRGARVAARLGRSDQLCRLLHNGRSGLDEVRNHVVRRIVKNGLRGLSAQGSARGVILASESTWELSAWAG